MNLSGRLVFDIAAGLASLISLFGWAGQEFIGFTNDTVRNLVFTVISLFFAYGLIFLLINYKEYKKLMETKDDNALAHKVTHHLRDAFSILRDIEFETLAKIEKAESESHIIEIVHADELRLCEPFKTFAVRLAQSVHRQVLNDLVRRNIRENIRITVKAIHPGDEHDQGEWIVKTVIMDPKTWEEWTNNYDDADPFNDSIHKIKENTDFSRILIDKEKLFFNNDLAALGDGHYRNSSANWRKRYNSTLVVPIKNKAHNKGVVVYYGFLTVDSMNISGSELFTEKCSDNIFNIMAHAADALASWYIRYDSHVEVLGDKSSLRIGELFLSDYISSRANVGS